MPVRKLRVSKSVYGDLDDNQLAQRLKESKASGNSNVENEVLIEILDRNHDSLMNISANVLSNPDDRDESFQETAITLWDNIEKFDESVGEFQVWLYGVARNNARNIQRRNIRYYRRIQDAVTKEDDSPNESLDVECPPEETAFMTELMEEIGELPSRQRDCMLDSISGLEPQDIAEKQNVSPEVVWTAMSRARKTLGKDIDLEKLGKTISRNQLEVRMLRDAGFSPQEIAENLGISRSIAESRLKKLKEK